MVPHAPAFIGALGRLLAIPAHHWVAELRVCELAAFAIAKHPADLLLDLSAQAQRRGADAAGKTREGRRSADPSNPAQPARLGARKRRGRVRQQQRRGQPEPRHTGA